MKQLAVVFLAAPMASSPDLAEDGYTELKVNSGGDIAQWARRHGFRTPHAARGRSHSGPGH